MDYNIIMNNVSMVMFVLACLVFSVNIIAEVVKKIFTKVPTSLLATVVSIVITMISYFAWVSYTGVCVVWYHVAGALVLGIFVAYAAMFGFDKFKQSIEKLKNYKK